MHLGAFSFMENLTPDFKAACEKANEILVCSNSITSFPFSMAKVIEDFTEIEMRPFSSIFGHELSPEQITGSKDGALFTDGNGNYLMYYNEVMPQTRLRFTSGHETGHYMLNHDMELVTNYRQTNDKRFEPLYKKYEAESNMFAAELLMPEPIIIELFKRGCVITEKFLENTFKVSKEAAEIRIKNIKKIYNWDSFRKYRTEYGLSYDDIIRQKFKLFIDSVAPRKYSYIEEYEREEAMEKERQTWY